MNMPVPILALLLAATQVAAAPAPWYRWQSKLTGQQVCAQVLPGEWSKIGGPYQDARCATAAPGSAAARAAPPTSAPR
jgi:hypothetical protein